MDIKEITSTAKGTASIILLVLLPTILCAGTFLLIFVANN